MVGESFYYILILYSESMLIFYSPFTPVLGFPKSPPYSAILTFIPGFLHVPFPIFLLF